MKFIRDVLLCLFIGLLIIVTLNVSKAVHDVDELAKSSNALVTEANTRMVGTSQNLNAILIQFGLVADNIRRASESQDAVSKKTLALLDSTNKLLEHAQENTDQITLHTVQTLDDVKPVLVQLATTTEEVNKLVADQNIPQILANLNDTSKQATATMQQATATMENVNKTTAHVEGWVAKAVKPPSRAKRIFNVAISTLIVAAKFL